MHSSIEQRQVFLWGDSFAKDKTTEDKRDPTVHPTVVYLTMLNIGKKQLVPTALFAS